MTEPKNPDPQASETIARDFSADADSLPWLEVRTVDLRRELSKSNEKKQLAAELRVILEGENGR